jgi:hypothetical protein
MAYTTNQLISSSFYASGVVSREFETVSGQQIADGLVWLNNIITEKAVDDSMVPYESTYTFNSVAGQEVYEIPGLIQIDTLVFYKNSVRFSMMFTPRNQYFGSNRVENIKALPYSWFFERQLRGGNLYIYFSPDQNYPMEIKGVFELSSVSLGQDLSAGFDQFYTTYLHYALADRICAEYNYDTPQNVLRQLRKYEAFIAKKSRVLDLTLNKTSILGTRSFMNWSWANLGRGYLP